MMKKNIFILAFVAVLISLLTLSSALAAGKTGKAGKSNVGHLYLYEKNPDTWEIVEGGAWGKMKYNLSGSEFEFVFNGHELAIGVEYTLIYYPNPWPGNGLIILGDGTADEYGNVHIKGKIDTGNLPAEGDENDGAKIWLVLHDDVAVGGMTGWTPDAYLFEYDMIKFTDTDTP